MATISGGEAEGVGPDEVDIDEGFFSGLFERFSDFFGGTTSFLPSFTPGDSVVSRIAGGIGDLFGGDSSFGPPSDFVNPFAGAGTTFNPTAEQIFGADGILGPNSVFTGDFGRGPGSTGGGSLVNTGIENLSVDTGVDPLTTDRPEATNIPQEVIASNQVPIFGNGSGSKVPLPGGGNIDSTTGIINRPTQPVILPRNLPRAQEILDLQVEPRFQAQFDSAREAINARSNPTE